MTALYAREPIFAVQARRMRHCEYHKAVSLKSESCNLKELRDPGADLSEWTVMSSEAIGFVQVLLVLDPKQRPSAKVAIEHMWFTGVRESDVFKAIQQLPTRKHSQSLAIDGFELSIYPYIKDQELENDVCVWDHDGDLI